MFKKFLCYIGIHKWEYPITYESGHYRKCKLCDHWQIDTSWVWDDCYYWEPCNPQTFTPPAGTYAT